MSDSTPSSASTGTTPSAATASSSTDGTRWSVLLPVLTFVVGLVLGAVALGISGLDDAGSEGPLALESPTAAPSRTPSGGASPGDLRVIVPASCVQAAEQAEAAYAVLDSAVTAVRDFDARALADVVDRAQTERAETEQLIDACRDAAGPGLIETVPGSTPDPTPEPAPSS